jgi:hypothetical protein
VRASGRPRARRRPHGAGWVLLHSFWGEQGAAEKAQELRPLSCRELVMMPLTTIVAVDGVVLGLKKPLCSKVSERPGMRLAALGYRRAVTCQHPLQAHHSDTPALGHAAGDRGTGPRTYAEKLAAVVPSPGECGRARRWGHGLKPRARAAFVSAQPVDLHSAK